MLKFRARPSAMSELPFVLSQNELERQQKLITEMRHLHQQEIVDSGLAERLIMLSGGTNKNANRKPFGPLTSVFPVRCTLIQQRTGHVGDVLKDVGAIAPLDRLYGTEDDPTYQLGIVRDETFARPRISGYTLGVQVGEAALQATNERRFLPVEGIEVKDLFMIQQQLGEIAAMRENCELSLIDNHTLDIDYRARRLVITE